MISTRWPSRDAQKGEDAKKQFVEAMKSLLGEKSKMWFGTDGKTVVQVNAPDWKAAQKLLDQYANGKDTAGDAQAFRDLRKEMPARTSLLGMIDAVQMLKTIAEVVKPGLPPAIPLPPGWPNVPAKAVAAYIGLAVTLQPNRGSFDLFITAAAAQQFYNAAIKPFLGE